VGIIQNPNDPDRAISRGGFESIDRDYTKDVNDWLAEGRAEGRLDTVRNFLSVRFGQIPPALDEKLATLSSAQLDRLLIESVSWKSIEYWNRE
jgi:Domain of unknown function (DUF4351)